MNAKIEVLGISRKGELYNKITCQMEILQVKNAV
jgi:hypothetical protein